MNLWATSFNAHDTIFWKNGCSRAHAYTCSSYSTVMMAAFPMTPVKPSSPRKRLSPDDSDNSDNGRYMEPPTKRMRMEPTMPKTPPPEEEIFDGGEEKKVFPDDDPHQLLLRSIVLALKHIGFDSATPAALEAICSQVDTCQNTASVCSCSSTNSRQILRIYSRKSVRPC